MINNSIIQATSSWPFVEARKLVKDRQKIFEKKGKIILQTGYGPSGLPHIGTFAEVARTTMVANAIKQLIDNPGLRAQLGVNGRATVDQYRWDRVADSVFGYYREVSDKQLVPPARYRGW